MYIAVKGLGVHKVRTFLSMLGIIFGIASVIAMLSIGEGARQQIKKQIEAMGVNNIRVKEIRMDKESRKKYRVYSPGLTVKDAEKIAAMSNGIYAYAPMIVREMKVNRQDQQAESIIVGTTSEFLKVSSAKLAKGRFLSPIDEKNCRRVCVLGSMLEKRLFPFTDPIKKQILIHNEYYTIIGIMKPKQSVKSKQKVFDVVSLNQRCYIPLSCAMNRLTRPKITGEIDEISIRTLNTQALSPTGKLIDEILKISHHKQKDYEVIIALDLLIQSQKSQRIFDIVMGSIAGISLLVGGIGIMNIMLANVSERRREIGIRRAIGARQRDVRRQFLLEASSVCLLGGVIGIFLGIGLAATITYFFNWETVISTWGIALSLSVSLMDGIIFGTYPAWKAAKMDPIEALAVE